MEKEEIRKLVWVGIFAMAMAFVEAMVVFALRKLYYPDNILFPLKSLIPTQVLIFEGIREAATIIMLLTVAILAGKKAREKFAYFIYTFAIWDIFYYIWLKITIDWPASLMTWDVLFLIPVTWVSPVICPIIVSLTMILGAYLFLNYSKTKFTKKQIILLILGGILIYASFVWNYSTLFFEKAYVLKFSEVMIGKDIINLALNLASSYIPTYFNWPIFIIGEIAVLLALFLFYKSRKNYRV
jgi:hypothetical protein